MDSVAKVRGAFQDRLLAAIYKGRSPGELVLKGGRAMKIITGSARYTKDLDLDHDPNRGLEGLVKSIRKAIDLCFVGGYKKVAVTEPKQTDTVARWKIQALGPRQEPFQVTIEVSRRHAIDSHEVNASLLQISDRSFPARVYVDVYTADKLVEMKLRALLDDNRIAPRDIYDLDLLISEGARPSAEAIASLRSQHVDIGEQLLRKLEAMPWELFESQALSVIPDDLQLRIDRQEYAAMKDRILRSVLDWSDEPPADASPS